MFPMGMARLSIFIRTNHMNVAIEKLPECRARVSAEVPASEVEDTRDFVVEAFMTQAKIPGFRPGKLPRKVVEKKFGSEIEKEVRDRLSRSVLQKAGEEEEIGILGVAKVERDVFENDGAYSFISEVVTTPEFDLEESDYKGIEVTVEKREVDKEMIDDFLERVQRNFAEHVPSEDGVVERGDKAELSFSARQDNGEPLADILEEQAKPLAEGEGLELPVPLEEMPQENDMIPGLTSEILGMKAGESKSFAVSFPEDHFVEGLQGVEATYEVTVGKVLKAELPEVNDELANRIGHGSLDELKDAYQLNAEQEIENSRVRQIENQILEHINKEHEFDLPNELVYNETQAQVNQMVVDAYQRGMGQEDIDKYEEDIVATAGQRAVNNLRTRYLLGRIAEREKLDVSDDELFQHIVMAAQRAGKPPKKYARELRDGPGIEAVRNDLLISKTIAFLRENATITETAESDEDGDSSS